MYIYIFSLTGFEPFSFKGCAGGVFIYFAF